MRNTFKISLKIFRITLLTITLTLILLSISAIVLTVLDSYKLNLTINKQGFIYFLSLFDAFKTLLAATFIIIPVYLALETLISNINNQEGKALLDLRGILNEPESKEIHIKIRGQDCDWGNGIPQYEQNDANTWRKIDNYLGVLELINILIDKNVISIENFNNQFGYRVNNVFQNQDIKDYIDNTVNNEVTWKGLYCLFKKRGLMQ